MKDKPVDVGIEGDRWTWWYVCGECHTAINPGDEICRECKRKLKWDVYPKDIKRS